MGLKTVLWNTIKVLFCVPLFVTGIWMQALLTDPSYTLRQDTSQEELNILSISVMGSLSALFICTITPNIDIIHSIGKIPALLLVLEGSLILCMVAFPIVALSLYPDKLKALEASTSPLWAPLLVWSITMFGLAVWQVAVFVVYSFSLASKKNTSSSLTSSSSS